MAAAPDLYKMTVVLNSGGRSIHKVRMGRLKIEDYDGTASEPWLP